MLGLSAAVAMAAASRSSKHEQASKRIAEYRAHIVGISMGKLVGSRGNRSSDHTQDAGRSLAIAWAITIGQLTLIHLSPQQQDPVAAAICREAPAIA